jgi:hypothetical protein
MYEADAASGTSARDPFVDHLLAELHNIYRQTSNPAFVWQAINCCDPANWGHRTEIPEWCLDPLFDAARKIMALIHEDKSDGPPSAREWKRRLERIPGALGLSSQGRNQLKNAASALRKIETAKAYHLDRAAKKSSAKDALDDTMKALDARREARPKRKKARRRMSKEDQTRAGFAEVAEGVRLSTGGKGAPRRRSGKGKVIKPTG